MKHFTSKPFNTNCLLGALLAVFMMVNAVSVEAQRRERKDNNRNSESRSSDRAANTRSRSSSQPPSRSSTPPPTSAPRPSVSSRSSVPSRSADNTRTDNDGRKSVPPSGNRERGNNSPPVSSANRPEATRREGPSGRPPAYSSGRSNRPGNESRSEERDGNRAQADNSTQGTTPRNRDSEVTGKRVAPDNRVPNTGNDNDYRRRGNNRTSRDRNSASERQTPNPVTNGKPGQSRPDADGRPWNRQADTGENRNLPENNDGVRAGNDRADDTVPTWLRPPTHDRSNRQSGERRHSWKEPRRPISNRSHTPRYRRPDHKRPPQKVYIPVPVYNYPSSGAYRSYYYSYSDNSSLWPYDAFTSDNYYTNQGYYRYRDNYQYQNNELGSFSGEVRYFGDDDWFEYRANNKTWQVVLLHDDTVHPEEGDLVQVIGYVVDDTIYAEHVRILRSDYEYSYDEEPVNR